jgi:hypothetical protein
MIFLEGGGGGGPSPEMDSDCFRCFPEFADFAVKMGAAGEIFERNFASKFDRFTTEKPKTGEKPTEIFYHLQMPNFFAHFH